MTPRPVRHPGFHVALLAALLAAGSVLGGASAPNDPAAVERGRIDLTEHAYGVPVFNPAVLDKLWTGL